MDKFTIKDLVVSLGVEPCNATQIPCDGSHVPRSALYLCKASQMRCESDFTPNELAELRENLERILAQLRMKEVELQKAARPNP